MGWLWESLGENREEAGERQEAENPLKVGNMNAGGLGPGRGREHSSVEER